MASKPSSKSSKFRPERQAAAITYAEILRASPTSVISEKREDKRKLRIFDSKSPLIRVHMKESLERNISNELGEEFLENRKVNIETSYEIAPIVNPSKLLSITISIVDKDE